MAFQIEITTYIFLCLSKYHYFTLLIENQISEEAKNKTIDFLDNFLNKLKIAKSKLFIRQTHQISSMVKSKNVQSTVGALFFTQSLFITLNVSAQTASPILPPIEVQRYQEQQFQVAKERALNLIDVLTPDRAGPLTQFELPVEVPCFKINEVELVGGESFPWLSQYLHIEGACFGGQGLKKLKGWITQYLINRGYITAQVNIPEQDLAKGHLIIEIIPGRIGEIREEGFDIGKSFGIFPGNSNKLLNIRDLDQALENIRRLPGQAGTIFDLIPGIALGETDIVIQHPKNTKRIHVVLTADNSGIDTTGRNQLGVIVAIDSPLHLYDQLIFTFNSDAEFGNHTLASSAKGAVWNVPIGYASFSFGVNEWSSRQKLSYSGTAIPYTGRTRRFEVGMSYVPYRSSHNKGLLQIKLVRRQDQAWLGGAELDVQKHDISSYEIRLQHREEVTQASFDANIGLQGSLAGISSFPGSVNGQSTWNGRYQIITANAGTDVKFQVNARHFYYRGKFSLQYALMPTPSTEYLQIGGLYTVRGFDGNRTLAAQSGWTWRNELSTVLTAANETYIALDAGRVSSMSTVPQSGGTLVGSALGLRGNYKWLGYDISLGLPLAKPKHFQNSTTSLNILLTKSF